MRQVMPIHCSASFEDMALDFDRLFADVGHLSNLEGETLASVLKEHGALSVLDCACGTGVQSIELARRGYQLAASDVSATMLSQLHAKARLHHLSIETRLADFCDLRAWQDKRFDAVICAGNSLTLVPDKDQIHRALESMIRATHSPGGVVIVGLHNYPKLQRQGQNLFVRHVNVGPGGPELILDLRLFETERVQVTYLFIRWADDQWHMKTYTKSYIALSAEELRDAMLEAGMRAVRLLDITGQREFEDDEWVLAVGTT
jgi:ubiquinone/menaquinone biosynthesis C-methylase UbiE